MKRSTVNALLREAEELFRQYNISLPPFGSWSPQEWADRGREYDEIRDNMLGWDVTDYGLGRFSQVGLVLFTLRNGNAHREKYAKPYAEKLLVTREDQVCPMHFHFDKMEDIINRGGGNLMIELRNSTPEGELADTPVTVHSDGRVFEVPAGSVLRFLPGESITLTPGLYHKFWAERGRGTVLLGEVSKVNDDVRDNRFLEPLGRFPEIEEDEPVYRYLCNEYPAARD